MEQALTDELSQASRGDEADNPPSLMEEPELDCPFCGFKTDSEYQIMACTLHMETLHAEGQSPFVAGGDDTSIAAMISMTDEEGQYASCPVEGCGEGILFTELDSHIEMHGNELGHNNGDDDVFKPQCEDEPDPKKPRLKNGVQEAFGTKLSHALRNLNESEKNTSGNPPPDGQTKAKAEWKNLLNMPESSSSTKLMARIKPQAAANGSPRRRLGKSELGPHANEKQMPSYVTKILERDGALEIVNRIDPKGKMYKVRTSMNRASGILPVVGRLLEQDVSTDFVYLCHPAVKHISKLRGEGGFCGYRNIQMMCSYIVDVGSQGWQTLHDKVPSIFEIQEYIEHAWDLGINEQGRVETGGIRGTRKYIGTPDAQAMFVSLDISCDAQGIRPKKKSDGPTATQMLFQAAQEYFASGCTDFEPKVRRTALSPIYFQHPGHSITIVGFEQKRDGSQNLIVFDPMFHDAANVMRLVGNDTFKQKSPSDMLKAYRRGVRYLRKYNEFEILTLTPPDSQKGHITKGTWASEASPEA